MEFITKLDRINFLGFYSLMLDIESERSISPNQVIVPLIPINFKNEVLPIDDEKNRKRYANKRITLANFLEKNGVLNSYKIVFRKSTKEKELKLVINIKKFKKTLKFMNSYYSSHYESLIENKGKNIYKQKIDKEKKVFLITSCDPSYQKLNDLVSVIVHKILKYKLIISERDTEKDGQILLDTIYNSIKESEHVLIDIISDNFNIAFETGIAYTFREEKIFNKKILFLVPQYLFDENKVPVDIIGIKLTTCKNNMEYKNKILDFFKIKSIDRDIDDELNAILKQIPVDLRFSKQIKNEELYINTRSKIRVPVYDINRNNSIFNNLTIFICNNYNSKIELTNIIISSDFPFFSSNSDIILFGKSYSLNNNIFKIQLESPIIIANDQELELILRFRTNSKINYKDKYDFNYILNTLQSGLKIKGSFTIYTEIIEKIH